METNVVNKYDAEYNSQSAYRQNKTNGHENVPWHNRMCRKKCVRASSVYVNIKNLFNIQVSLNHLFQTTRCFPEQSLQFPTTFKIQYKKIA